MYSYDYHYVIDVTDFLIWIVFTATINTSITGQRDTLFTNSLISCKNVSNLINGGITTKLNNYYFYI